MIISGQNFEEQVSDSIQNEKKWVVAISGGADSLCLTLMASEYAKSHEIELIACFVDHKLRPESSTEILPIIEILAKRNIKHSILIWDHSENITRNVEHKARKARYELLRNFCESIGCKVLLTGHHALDQWETFFMRLSKGSSLRGLSCIAPISSSNGLTLFRPFLPFPPEDIKETLAASYGITDFVSDPSNNKIKYERVRWRKAYPALSKDYGLDIENVNKSIERMRKANDCLNELAINSEAEIFDGEYINILKYRALPLELRIRVLQRIIKRLQNKEIISYSLLERVASVMCEKDFVATNIAGLIFRRDKTKKVKVSREKRK